MKNVNSLPQSTSGSPRPSCSDEKQEISDIGSYKAGKAYLDALEPDRKPSEVLWNYYADSFLNFYLQEEDRKYLKSIENIDDIPF